MKTVWAWVFGIVIALFILVLLSYARSERRDYWAARGAVIHRAQAAQQQVQPPALVTPVRR